MAELVTTVGVEKDEAIAGTTRRDFLGKAAATGVAVGLIAAAGEGDARAAGLKKVAVPSLPARHPDPDAIPLWTSQTLLNDAGGLRAVVPESRYREWLSELKRLPTRVSSRRSALLNLWVGEYAMTTGQDQRKALHHFGVAASRTKPGDALHGWARYNTCLALAFDSRYEDAANGFAALLYDHKKTGEKPLHGFDWQIAGRWLRRLSARAAEFNRLGEMGIPRPPSLDTICGAGGLAACLRSLNLPSDKAHVLANVRVTGRGSTLQDLLDACPKLGVSGYAVTITGKDALLRLPKPLVAHVERDHFVGVLEANEKGVVYLCTDCGRWPVGRVEVSWEQWEAMTPGAALCVALPGSETDRVLAALTARKPGTTGEPVRVAAAGGIAGLSAVLLPMYHRLASAVVGYPAPPADALCGMPPGKEPKDPAKDPDVDPVDPVDLSNGEEIYSCSPDLVIYNPNGPDVVFQRYYNSLRGFDPSYAFDLFGAGWSHSYNICVYDPSAVGSVAPGSVPVDGLGEVLTTGTNSPGTSWYTPPRGLPYEFPLVWSNYSAHM